MTLAEFRALVAQRGSVVRDGRDLRGRCPAHDDNGRRGDLTFRESDGKIIVHCWRGCEPKSIVEALGLEWCDLFSGNGYGHKVAATRIPKRIHKTMIEAIETIARRRQQKTTGQIAKRNGRDARAVLNPCAVFSVCAKRPA